MWLWVQFKVTQFSEVGKHLEMTEKWSLCLLCLPGKRHKHNFLQELPELLELKRGYRRCPAENSSWIKCLKTGSVSVEILGTSKAKMMRWPLLLLERGRQYVWPNIEDTISSNRPYCILGYWGLSKDGMRSPGLLKVSVPWQKSNTIRLLLFKMIFLSFYVYECLLTCMCTTYTQYPWRPNEGISSTQNWSYRWLWVAMEVLRIKSGSLQKQQCS